MINLERFIRAVESDDVFEPMQVVLIPLLVFLACVVFGTP